MNIKIFQGHTAPVSSESTVIVIDVLRAFTVTSYLFDGGAKEIHLVRDVDDAFAVKESVANACLIGEVKGLPIEGFDYGNSPEQVINKPPLDRYLVMKTTNGVETCLNVQAAKEVLAVSMANVQKTIEYIKAQQSCIKELVIIATDRRHSDEDLACAHYIKDALLGELKALSTYQERIANSLNAKKFNDPNQPHFTENDLQLAQQIKSEIPAQKTFIKNGEVFLKAVV